MRCTRSGIIIGTAVAIVGIDQLTKAVTVGRGCSTSICPMRNDKLMLGIDGGAPGTVMILTLIGVATGIAGCIVLRVSRRLPALAVALVAGGVIGNVVDRLTLGYVRDFLAGPFGIVANAADLAVYAGLICLIWLAVSGTAGTARKEVKP